MMFNKETQFQNSPIGKIPEDWEVDKLETVVEIHDSKRIPLSEMERNGRKGPHPYCGANGIIDYINDYIFDGEYVLLAEDGGAYGKFENSAYVMSGKFWVNNHAHILRAIAGKTSNQFLKLVLDFLDLNPYIVGSTRKKLNQKQMREIKIPLPPVKEQCAVVGVLGVVDSAIGLVDEVIAKTERLKKGLMQELLTKGIGHKEYKDTPIGKIPREWELVKYKQANERIFVGIATSSTKFFSKQGVPLIRNQNIKEGRLDLSDLVFITRDFSEKNKSRMLKENDILSVRTGYPGLSCKVSKEMEGWHTFTTLIGRPNTAEFDPDYLVCVLNSPVSRSQILRLQAGLAQQNLNVQWIANLRIPKPPMQEQQIISMILKVAADRVEVERKVAAKLRRIKLGLMDLLLTGKVRVKVD